MGTRHRPRDPRPAEDEDEDVLPLRQRLRGRAEHAIMSRVPGISRRAADAERDCGGVDAQAGPRARLRDRAAGALPPQALPVSGPAEGLPDLPIRRAALPGRIVGAAHSNIDFNRGGTPLVEIVTRPDIRSAEQAKRFLQLLRQTVVELGLSDAEMEKGQLRADANVSVREVGETGYRTRSELKNMNSFNHIARGIDAEVRRQIGVWESGGEVVQQTLDYEVKSDTVTPRRRKEEADDYRYFPEPDLVPLEPPAEQIERLRSELPELPGRRIRRFERDYGLSFYDAEVLNGSAGLAALYERVALDGVDAKSASNVLMNDFVATGVDPATVNAEELAKVIAARATIPRATFVRALAESADPEFKAETYLGEALVADTSELEPLVDRILAAHPGQVAAYKGGKQGLLGFFVGQVMKETQGKADPKVVNDLLRAKLS